MLAGYALLMLVLLQMSEGLSKHFVGDFGRILWQRKLLEACAFIELNYAAFGMPVIQRVFPHVERLSDFRLCLQVRHNRK